MKAKPMKQTDTGQEPCEPQEATHVWLNMPGPIPTRMIPVIFGNATRAGTNCWSWNGSVEKPTLRPSIRTRDGHYTCHTWVNDGQAQFLNDCTHELAGQTLDLLEVDF
jgi:hypothetical protein